MRYSEAAITVQGVDLHALVSNIYAWDMDAGPRNIAIVFAFGVGFRMLAVIAMILTNRGKKL